MSLCLDTQPLSCGVDVIVIIIVVNWERDRNGVKIECFSVEKLKNILYPKFCAFTQNRCWLNECGKKGIQILINNRWDYFFPGSVLSIFSSYPWLEWLMTFFDVLYFANETFVRGEFNQTTNFVNSDQTKSKCI